MSIGLTRIGFRLIRGQVITRWLTQCQIDEIVIIDTVPSKGIFMQGVFKTVAPKGAKIAIVNVEDAARHQQEGASDKSHVMVLFEGMAELNAVIQADLKSEKVQIGGLSRGLSHKAVSNAVTLDGADADTLLELEKVGTEIYFQTTPDYPSEMLQKTIVEL